MKKLLILVTLLPAFAFGRGEVKQVEQELSVKVLDVGPCIFTEVSLYFVFNVTKKVTKRVWLEDKDGIISGSLANVVAVETSSIENLEPITMDMRFQCEQSRAVWIQHKKNQDGK